MSICRVISFPSSLSLLCCSIFLWAGCPSCFGPTLELDDAGGGSGFNWQNPDGGGTTDGGLPAEDAGNAMEDSGQKDAGAHSLDAGDMDAGTISPPAELESGCNLDGGPFCDDEIVCSTDSCLEDGICSFALDSTCSTTQGTCNDPYPVSLTTKIPTVEVITPADELHLSTEMYDWDGCIWPDISSQYYYGLEIPEAISPTPILITVIPPPGHEQFMIKLAQECPGEGIWVPAHYCGPENAPWNAFTILTLSGEDYRVAVQSFTNIGGMDPFHVRFHSGLRELKLVASKSGPMDVGEERFLIPDLYFQNHDTGWLVKPELVKWLSSDPSVVEVVMITTANPGQPVDRAGTVRALADGTATISSVYGSEYVLNEDRVLMTECIINVGLGSIGIGNAPPCAYDSRIDSFEPPDVGPKPDAGAMTDNCDEPYEVVDPYTGAEVICDGSYFIPGFPDGGILDGGEVDAGAMTAGADGGPTVYAPATLADIQDCTTITGDLVVQDEPTAGPIELPNLVKVNGTLRFEDDDAMTTLSFPLLEEVGGDFFLYRNDALINFKAPKLQVVDSLLLVTNKVMTGFNLSSLARINGELSIFENDLLANCLWQGLRSQVQAAAGICETGGLFVLNNDDPACVCTADSNGVLLANCP